MTEAVLDCTARSGLVRTEARWGCEGMVLVGWHTVPVHVLAALPRTRHRRWWSGGRASTRFRASTVAREVGRSEVGYRWGSRRKMRIILAGYRTLIAVGGSRGLMRVDVGYLTVSCCEGHEVSIAAVAVAVAVVVVVVAAETMKFDRHMKMVAAHFEVDTEALECESLPSLVKVKSSAEWVIPGGAPLGPGV